MLGELWYFFRKKLRKGNGVWWALGYTWFHYRWLRIERNPKRLAKWQEEI